MGLGVSEWNLNGQSGSTNFVSHLTENSCGYSEWNLESSIAIPEPFFTVSDYMLSFSSAENSMYLGVI